MNDKTSNKKSDKGAQIFLTAVFIYIAVKTASIALDVTAAGHYIAGPAMMIIAICVAVTAYAIAHDENF